jgi:hypothetical protein
MSPAPSSTLDGRGAAPADGETGRLAGHHPAEGDCEELRDGWLAQPVNAVSCVSFLVAAVWLWRRLASTGSTSPEAALFCALVAANGVGGIAFHGPGDRTSHWLHDTALVGTLAAMAASRAPVGAAATAVAGAGLAVRPSATNVASVVGTAAVAGATALGRGPGGVRTGAGPAAGGRRRVRPPRARTGVLLVVAAAVDVLTRTGAPCCRPRSWLQGHALWHVLTATALADWGLTTFAAGGGGAGGDG